MGIQKNTAAKAAPAKAAAPKTAAKAPAKAAAKPAAAPAKKTPVKPAPVKDKAAEVESARVSRKDIAEGIVAKVKATGMGVPLKLAEVMAVAYEELVGEALAAGKEVNLPGFGKFSVQHKEASEGRNPSTGEAITIAARNVARFKVGSKLKALLNGGEVGGEE